MDLSSGYALRHGNTGFPPIVGNKLAGKAQPIAVLKCADFNLWVNGYLSGNFFPLSGLDIGSSVKNMRRSEGTDPRLVAFNRSKVINLCVFKKFTNSFRKNSSFLYDCGFCRSFNFSYLYQR